MSISEGNINPIENLLSNALPLVNQAEVRVTKWGNREISIKGEDFETEQWVSLNSLAKEIKSFVKQHDVKQGYRGISFSQRIKAHAVMEKINELYASTDAQISQKNIIIRIFNAIGTFFQRVAAFFKLYSPRMYIEKKASDVFMMFTKDELLNAFFRVPSEFRHVIGSLLIGGRIDGQNRSVALEESSHNYAETINAISDLVMIARNGQENRFIASVESLKNFVETINAIRPGSADEENLYPDDLGRKFLIYSMGEKAGEAKFLQLLQRESLRQNSSNQPKMERRVTINPKPQIMNF